MIFSCTVQYNVQSWSCLLIGQSSGFQTQYSEDNVKIAEQTPVRCHYILLDVTLIFTRSVSALLIKRLTCFCETEEQKQRNERETVVLH